MPHTIQIKIYINPFDNFTVEFLQLNSTHFTNQALSLYFYISFKWNIRKIGNKKCQEKKKD